MSQPLNYIEPWWKRIGCMREQKAMTGEEAAMCDEIKDLREALTPDADAVDYKELLKKYMGLVRDAEGIDFLYCPGSSIGERNLSKEEVEELESISKEVRDE